MINQQTKSRLNEQCNQLSRVAVIIPAYNEAASIQFVLSDLPQVGRVIVVDNGSTDETGRIAAAMGAQVVTESRRGYGSACLAGINELRRLEGLSSSACDVVVFIDGDFSDYPEELPKLIEPIMKDQADFVLGSRLMGHRDPGAMPVQSLWGNRLATFLMWCFWKTRYTDLGPFRAIAWDCLKRLEMQDTNFGWTVEMQIKAQVHGLRIQEIPVNYRVRIGCSKISGTISGTIGAGYKILTTIARYRWLTGKDRLPSSR